MTKNSPDNSEVYVIVLREPTNFARALSVNPSEEIGGRHRQRKTL